MKHKNLSRPIDDGVHSFHSHSRALHLVSFVSSTSFNSTMVSIVVVCPSDPSGRRKRSMGVAALKCVAYAACQ